MRAVMSIIMWRHLIDSMQWDKPDGETLTFIIVAQLHGKDNDDQWIEIPDAYVEVFKDYYVNVFGIDYKEDYRANNFDSE